jgi:hypothetical protein
VKEISVGTPARRSEWLFLCGPFFWALSCMRHFLSFFGRRLRGHLFCMYNTRNSVEDSAHIVLNFFSSIEHDYVGIMVVPLLLGM